MKSREFQNNFVNNCMQFFLLQYLCSCWLFWLKETWMKYFDFTENILNNIAVMWSLLKLESIFFKEMCFEFMIFLFQNM